MNRNAGKGKRTDASSAGTEPGKKKVKKSHGRQMSRNAAWPAEKGGHQQCRHRTWETKVKKSLLKCYMANGKGRTPAATDLGDK